MAKEPEKRCFACPASYPAAYSSCPKCQLPLVFADIGKVWHVEGLVGRGGMGAVFAAHHVEDRRKRAAVKVLVPIAGEMKADRADRIARFQREAEAMGRLIHQNIVQLYDFSRERDGSLYLAMEFLEGPTLSKILKERGPLPEAEAIELMLPVLSAVEAAHKVGVIHRDLKPDNIVLATISDGKKESQRVKVVDFGVARLKGDSMTDAGQALGTPVYMAPEQAQGGDIDERVDVYGTGAVLYELLTGRPPFVAPDQPNANLVVLAKILTTEPPPLRDSCPELSEALESVVLHAMCRDRDLRFRSCTEFIAALRAAQKNPHQALWQKPEEVAQLALPPAVAAAAAQPPPRASRRSIPPPRSSLSAPQGPLHIGHSGAAVPVPQLSSRSGPAPSSPMVGGRSGPAPSSPMVGGRSGPAPSSPMAAGRSGPAPAAPLSVGRSGPAVRRISNPPASPSSPMTGRSSTSSGPAWASRSAQAVPAVPSAESGTAGSSAHKQRGSSVAYKVLITLVYLIAVSVILVSLLLDRTSCRRRVSWDDRTGPGLATAWPPSAPAAPLPPGTPAPRSRAE